MGDDAVAIIGIGCRFPGADNIDEFWHLLRSGENHVSEIPRDRFNISAFYDEDKDKIGKTYNKTAGLVRDYDMVDSPLYGISESEASRMDPQQSFVLDCTHMALEDAGIPPSSLRDSKTGVYIGCMNADYKSDVVMDVTDISQYSLTGNTGSAIASRVAYTFSLQGPAMMIDTACSAALVALHTAARAIGAGDADMAICGGVNVIMHPHAYVALSRAKMAGTTGQCQAFSDNADGYARGEGCGIIIIKKYSKAVVDGNKIWARMLMGCNQDGRTVTPMTAPSGYQQAVLLKNIYKQCGVDPMSIQYIEAHGTGTPIGDPTEVNALGYFFSSPEGDEEKDEKPVFDKIKIGSVKSNIGHLESGAGVASVIKMVLMMKHGEFVPSLMCEPANKKILFDQFRIEISKEVCEWRANSTGQRLGCINCFGFGGTNSHAIVIQDNVDPFPCHGNIHGTEYVFVQSAENKASLKAGLRQTLSSLNENSCLNALSSTSVLHRDHYLYRKAFCVGSVQDLKCSIKSMLEKDATDTSLKSNLNINVVAVFRGIESYENDILDSDKSFISGQYQTLMKKIIALIHPKYDNFGNSFLQGDQSKTTKHFGRIIAFAKQVAFFEKLKSCDIFPNTVVGMLEGNLPTAYLTGKISLVHAVEILQSSSSSASHNVAILKGKDMPFTQGHKHMSLTANRNGYYEKLATLNHTEPTPLQSAIEIDKINICIDFGRTGSFDKYSERVQENHEIPTISSLPCHSNNDFKKVLCVLYQYGLNIRWEAVVEPCCNITTFPRYEFNRSTKLHQTEKWKLCKNGLLDPFHAHQFIRRCPEYKPRFKVTLTNETTPLLYEHYVSNVNICPGSLHAEIGFEIGKRLFQCHVSQLDVSTEIYKPIRVSRDRITELDVIVEDTKNVDEVRVLSFFVHLDNTMVARGSVQKIQIDEVVEEFVDLSEVQDVCPNRYSRDKTYDVLQQVGFSYGEDLKLLHDGFTGNNTCLCHVELSQAITDELTKTNIHPSVLDGLLQTPGLFLHGASDLQGKSILPIGSESITLRRPLLTKMLAYGYNSKRIRDDLYFDTLLLSPKGSIICEVKNYATHIIEVDKISPLPRSFAYSCFLSKIENHSKSLAKLEFIHENKTADIMYIILSVDENQSQKIVDILKPERCLTLPFSTEGIENMESSLTNVINERRIIVLPKQIDDFSDASGDDVFDAVFFNCQTFLKFVTYLFKAGIKEHVFILTNNVVKDWDSNKFENVCIFGSELYGWVRSVIREQLIQNITLIDIESINSNSINMLETAFDISIAEKINELKITENGLYQPSINRIPFRMTIATKDEKDLGFSKGCYVIVGGFSGLGFETLKILASQGAASLAVFSRRVPTDGNMMDIARVEKEFGCQVLVYQVDVTNYFSTEFALSKIQTLTRYPIKGILNGAGIMDNVLALNVSDELMKSVLLPKVKGTWNLHKASVKLGLELDIFIVHSSISAVLGNAGQSCYSAGNSFMDAIIHFRRSKGLAGQTINWGALDLGMMTEMLKNDNIKSNFEKGNLKLLSMQEIEACFLNSLTTDYSQIAYANTKEKNSVSLVLETRAGSKTGLLQNRRYGDYLSSTDLLSLSDMDLKGELSKIITYVASELFAVPLSALNKDIDFLELGLDSMIVMTFNTRLFDLTNVRVPVVSLLSEGTNIDTITGYIYSKLRPENETHMEKEIYELTPMQERLSRIQKEMPDDPSLITVVDMQLPLQLSDPDKWRSNLQYQIDQNSYLRSVFIRNEQGSHRIVLDVRDAKVDFELTSEDDMQTEMVWGMDKTQYYFDLENNLSVRAYFYEAKEGRSWIRFVFHDILFNLEIIRHLFEDMKQYALHRIFGEPVPRKRDAIDTASIIKGHLSRNISVLEKFWKDVLSEKQLLEVSLRPPSKRGCGFGKPEELFSKITKVSGDLFHRINHYLLKNRMTMFELVLCAFQILLRNLTSQTTVPVFVSVDLRHQCHGIGDTMSSCVNTIPIISEVRTNNEEFVTENVNFIRKCVDHAMMPMEKILSITEDQELGKKIQLHRLVVNEHFTLRGSLDTKMDIFEGFENKRLRHGSTQHETNLFYKIDDEKNEIIFQLVLNPEILGCDMHDKISQGIVNIIKDIINACSNHTS